MKLPYLALAALAAGLLATPAHAQPEIVNVQLDSATVLMNGRGFVPADNVVRGTLAEGADEEFELELDGTEYVVMAFCDARCSDLDLVLSDESGEEVDSDRALDDYPVLTVDGQSGTFVLSVQMATCSGQCHYGVQVFRKR